MTNKKNYKENLMNLAEIKFMKNRGVGRARQITSLKGLKNKFIKKYFRYD